MSNKKLRILSIKQLHNEKGAVDSTLMTIIGLFLVATLMFIVPMMSIAEKNDDIAQAKAQTAVTNFTDTVSNVGSIKPSDYEELVQQLDSTGNTFEITIEVQHLDENPGKKSTSTSGDLIGENVRYSTFTTEILDYMYPTEEAISEMSRNYPLKKGDNIIVTVRSTNKTLAQQLRTFVFKVTGQGTYELSASSSSMIVNNGTRN